jgi:hypothetical protein
MNRVFSKKNYKNSFFFFVDCSKNFESKCFKIDSFFYDYAFLFPNKFFSAFYNSRIDFDFLEKNEKLISFFFFYNKFFFKGQIKNLKTCLFNENFFENLEKKLNINFFLNFYFFFRHLYNFIFLLKKLAQKNININ